MSAYIIFEVRQRTWDRSQSREVAYLVDKGMADNTIEALYREAWKTVMSADWVPNQWFPVESYDVVKEGLDYFKVDDLNSDFPLFYPVQHVVFNVVPQFNANNFTISSTQVG